MNIEKRNGSYRVVVSCGFEGNKRIKRTSTFTPPKGLTPKQEQKAVLEFAEDFERKVKGGANVKYTKMTFRSFCNELYENHLATLKPRTASGYRIIMESRLIPHFGDMKMRDITSLDIQYWLSNLERKDGKEEELSRNSAGVWFRTLSAIMGKAYEWNVIDENPCKRVKTPAKPNSDVQALQSEDFETILKKVPEYPDQRARLFVLLVLTTGIREAEAAGLEWRDFDFDKHLISIVRTSQYIPGKGMVEGTPKSKNSVRTIPISSGVIKELQNYRKWQESYIEQLGELYEGKPGDNARLFTTLTGKPIYDSTLRSWLKKVIEWCDVPHVTVHGLRHTFASILTADGVDPRTTADLLGQSSPALVMNVYANPQNEAKQRAIDTLDKHFTSKEDPA